MSTAVTSLTKDRGTVAKRLVTIQADILAWPPTVSIQQVKLMANRLAKYEERLETLFNEISQKCSETDFADTHQDDFNTVFASLESLRVRVADIQAAKEIANNVAAPAFKLERIKLPTFSGKFNEWQSFHDLFVSSVHTNTAYSGVEKMVHLRTCLVGEASSIISSFPVSEASYLHAWDLVKDRYSNKREIIFAHIRKFDEMKNIQEESASGLRGIADLVNETVRSLQVEGVQVQHWDLILIYYSLKKLDQESKKQWFLSQNGDLPKLEEFTKFLENRARALADSTSGGKKSGSSKNTSTHATEVEDSKQRPVVCIKCSNSHYLNKCPSFLKMSAQDRKDYVDKKQLCYNCLNKGHLLPRCKLTLSCKNCGKRHHTLIHIEHKKEQPQLPLPPTPQTTTQSVPPTQAGSTDPPTVVGHCAPVQTRSMVVLLGTLVGQVEDKFGNRQDCRVFLDPGSESHFVTEQFVDRIGLKRKKTCVTIKGIGDSPGESATGIVNIRLYSKVYDYFLDVNALILRKLTGILPRAQAKSTWSHLKELQLADPEYYKPGPIDILLGAQVAGGIMLPDIKSGSSLSPVAQHTKFGWVLSGEVPASTSIINQHAVISNHVSCKVNEDCNEECIGKTLQKFWELEEPEPTDLPPNDEDSSCEEHFLSTHYRSPDGRYHMELPFKPNAPALGSSLPAAVKRFQNLERRLSKLPLIKQEYIKCMRENISCGFMEQIPQNEMDKPEEESYYLPHREVVKESSITTKVRVVFDASSKTSSGVSLNDVLMTGPALQVDLVQLLIRFRTYLVAMASDIVKYYPQYGVNRKHVDFQRLVWRESTEFPLQHFRMIRLTFGVKPAPFLAIRGRHQLAEDECGSLPHIKSIIKNDFLVDNLLTGAQTIEEALDIQQHILRIMESGNLKLRQWSSNKEEILNALPAEDRQLELPLHISNKEECIKTIGILWNPRADSFGVSIPLPPTAEPITKRKVLSSIARIFDPLGWLAPVTIRPKILIQELWKTKSDWDSPIDQNLSKTWTDYIKDLDVLKSFKIDRCLTRPNSSSLYDTHQYELHGFSDGSKLAYSACVYIKTVDQDGVGSVNLVMAKTKVAPIKFETIPRLELCGAVLLTKVMNTVQNSCNITFSHKRCWTDNSGVQYWLKSDKKLPVFVCNRVRKIISLFPGSSWSHVSGADNPADCASRGISSLSLLNHKLWYHGPPWLASSSFYIKEEMEVSSNVVKCDVPLFSKVTKNCSSFLKMKRIAANCIRFVNNSRLTKGIRNDGSFSVDELSQGLVEIIRSVQLESFEEEISKCRKQQVVKSSIKFLAPFLDPNGILRVGGRLEHSSLPLCQKHPILLPRKHNFTEALVRYYHLINLHAAPQFLLSLVREEYWIIRGSDVVRHCVRRCITCYGHTAKTSNQIMGQLPAPRVNLSKPFSQTGMDFAGPYLICSRPGRNPVIRKSYVCVFVCMSTRAVHLEVVEDLSTPSFIATLIKFISRRGLPTDLYSDGGKNFVGAAKEVREIVKFLESTNHVNAVSDFLSEKGVNFHFNPPSSPHHGGLWEAGVKSMKYHLKRVIGERKLSTAEFSTLLCQVEAALNSRPLTPMSSDPNDFQVLTPGHFLTGGNLSALPTHDLTDLNTNRLSRWQLVQQMSQHFWRRWTTEYLKTLQSRPKWYAPQPNLAPGLLVIILDDNITWGNQKWKLGRMEKVYTGKDGKVRVCDVKTGGGSILKRPIVKLSPLPIY